MILLRNGRVHTPEQVFIGDVLIDGKKIKAVGKNLKPGGDVEDYNIKGLNLFPGFIDAHSHVGIFQEAIGVVGFDGNEWVDPVTPNLRAIDAIYPSDLGFDDALKAGITSVFTGPGSANVIGGQSVVVKTGGSIVVDERIVKNPAGMKMALGENPKRVYGEQKKSPATRMANAALIRDTLYQARVYMERKSRDKKFKEYNPKYEALIPVLKRQIPVRGHSHRSDDIATFVRLREEIGFKLVIEHGTESHLIADYLKKKKVPVVVGPSLSARVKVELKEITFDTPRILWEKGILFAIMTDAPVVPINYLPLMVGLSVKHGLKHHEGVKAITINAARICGVEKRIGRVKTGYDADITIYEGDPFTVEGTCVATIIDGKVMWGKIK